MDIVALDPHLLHTIQQTPPMIQKCVYDDTGAECERQQVRHGVRRGQEQRRVVSVRGRVERVLLGEDLRDVVLVAEAIVRDVGADGEVREGPRIGVVQDGGEDPEEHDETDEDVDLGPPGDHERRADPGDLGPVEREHTHAEAAGDAEELVDGDVVRRGPADEGKDGERLKEEAWGAVSIS